jgi:hypothetical protein
LGFQFAANCVLSEKDIITVFEVLMLEYGRRSVARCRDWTEASYVLAELADEARWFRDAGCWSQ